MTNVDQRRLDSEQRARELMRAGADRAVETFRLAVRPIYGATDRGMPDHIGSSVLLDIEDRKLLLTAAHVIDENASTSLYIGGADELVLVELEFFLTSAPDGMRSQDHYDFAFADIPYELSESLGAVKFIRAEECRSRDVGDARRLFTAVGYPNSKNKQPRGSQTTVRGQFYQYSSIHRFEPRLAAEIGITGREHLFIDHRKQAFDETGAKVSPVAPRGLSGGAILESVNFGDPEVVLGQEAPTPLLAGITIERYPNHGTLLGTKIEPILATIRSSKPTGV